MKTKMRLIANTAWLLASTHIQRAMCQQPANATPSITIDDFIEYPTSGKDLMLTQAINFVASMQTAPTCTRMAVSHLVNECKLLEHAPEFAKLRPEAYLDALKTEYAAKLAVCELLSAQLSNPVPPPGCEILVPSSKACDKTHSWWYSRREKSLMEQPCYPESKDYQYAACLKTLQSSPQYWTSFSNARQNAAVMCQASRNTIERENSLKTFKNLTQVMQSMSSVLHKSRDEYDKWLQGQNAFTDDVREAQKRHNEELRTGNENALTTVRTLVDECRRATRQSVNELGIALADHQRKENARLHEEFQALFGSVMAESSKLAHFMKAQYQAHHERQIKSYEILSGRMTSLNDVVDQLQNGFNAALNASHEVVQELSEISISTSNIKKSLDGFLPLLSTLLQFHSIVPVFPFFFGILFRVDKVLAVSVAGAYGLSWIFHMWSLFDWLGNLPNQLANIQSHTLVSIASADWLSLWKAAALVLAFCLGACGVGCIKGYLGSIVGTKVDQPFRSYWLRNCNDEESANPGGAQN